MGLTWNEAKALGIEHLWPETSKAAPIIPPAKTAAPNDGMNKLEREFWERANRNNYWKVYREGLTFRLAGRTRYTPDFVTIASDVAILETIRCWEVKGFMRDDAAVKLKVAAEMFPAFRFILVTREKRAWQCRDVTSRGIDSEVWCPDWLR